jgi:hypothetical protein
MFRRTLLVLMVCTLNGCHAPPRPVELTAQDITLTDTDDYDVLFETCLEVLRVHGYKLDRVDQRAGLITTFPITSQQFFEFWRDDVETAYDVMEASLLTIRRRAEIQVLGEAEGSDHRLVVSVYREKLSTPDRQYNSSAAAFRVFSRTLPSTAGKTIVPERDDVWLPAGRDGLLERRLIREITGRAFAREWRAPVETTEPAVSRPADG